MLEELERLGAQAQEELEKASTLEALEAWRQKYLGRKGAITLALRSIGQLPPEQRPAAGQRANALNQALTQAFEARREALQRAALERDLAQNALDVRLPG
ncbi:MAG: phenylalanine--tRNA ligase subunit alpha, partial [Chloroflexi bacterium]|nr:phenylalanine--tRNA ligase subunit alpha [Chloroflexota bacterium]